MDVPRSQGDEGAHRAVYKLVVGSIPAGYDLHHRCQVPVRQPRAPGTARPGRAQPPPLGIRDALHPRPSVQRGEHLLAAVRAARLSEMHSGPPARLPSEEAGARARGLHGMSATARVEEAVGYAQAGRPVFRLHTSVNGSCTCGHPACRAVAKHPRSRGGHKSATTDTDTIRSWDWEAQTSRCAPAVGSWCSMLIPVTAGTTRFTTSSASTGAPCHANRGYRRRRNPLLHVLGRLRSVRGRGLARNRCQGPGAM